MSELKEYLWQYFHGFIKLVPPSWQIYKRAYSRWSKWEKFYRGILLFVIVFPGLVLVLGCSRYLKLVEGEE